jgi:hypothetical protein
MLADETRRMQTGCRSLLSWSRPAQRRDMLGDVSSACPYLYLLLHQLFRLETSPGSSVLLPDA